MEARTSEILSGLTDSETDAMIEVLLLAAFADGTLDEAETSTIKRALLTVDEFWLSPVDLERRMDEAKRRIEVESRETRLSTLRGMLPWPEQRVLALKLAIRVVAADGIVQGGERELILQAAEALGVRGEIVAAFAQR